MQADKPKIVHVVNDIKVGGVSAVLFDLLSEQKTSSFSFEIVNLSGEIDEQLKEKVSSLGVITHNLDYKFEEGFSLFDQYKKAFFTRKYRKKTDKIVHYINNLNPSVLHFHTLPRELMLGQFVAEIKACKLIYTDHLARVKPEEVKWGSKFLLKLPLQAFYKRYFVIAVGNAVERYIKAFNIDSVLLGLHVIQNKIKRNEERVIYENKPEINIVYVARISHVKGHWDLINAWMQTPNLGFHLYIVGPDEMNGQVQDFVKKNVFHNKITFTGSISNIKEFLKTMDMAVFPSYKEGLPIALLEKMQIGLPCIVSDIDELTTIIKHNENGIVFPLGDIKVLAEEIIQLAQSPSKREKLGMSAIKTINDTFVSKVGGINKEYEAIYKELLKNP